MLYIYSIMLKFDILDKYIPPHLPQFIDRSIRRFQKRHNLFMTVHAMTGRWYNTKENFLFHWWGTHRSGFCSKDRYIRKFDKNCLDNCGAAVETEALRCGKPFRHFCWKGVQELVVPFIWNGTLELIFYLGPFRGERPSDKLLAEQWTALPTYPAGDAETELIEETLSLGMAFYMRLHQENLQTPILPNRKEDIREYILRNACGTVSLSGLAHHLGISASRASHECLTLLGVPFQQLVLNVRMKKAAGLLCRTGEPIKSIAEKSGFSNVYYFTRMFRQFYNLPPARYRRKFSKPEDEEQSAPDSFRSTGE